MILLETNDPERPRAVATLRAWVQRELTLSDESLDFGEFDPDELREARILIRPGSAVSLTILGVRAAPERYRTWVAEGERPEDRILHVTLLPQPEGIVLSDTIYVQTNVKSHETIRLPVRGHARGKKR
jgi:hypothetical protein